MDILQVQDRLKNFSQDQLVSEMQAPSGNAPQFLVLSEIMRRKRMQDDFSAQQGAAGAESTVAQEAVASAGVPQEGIAGMAQAMAPNTDIARDTGVQAMASGGTVRKMQVGGAVSTDPAIISMANRSGMSVEEFLGSLSPEEAQNLINYANRTATRGRMTAMEPVGNPPAQEPEVGQFEPVNPSYEERGSVFANDTVKPPTGPLTEYQPLYNTREQLPLNITPADQLPERPVAPADRPGALAGVVPYTAEDFFGSSSYVDPGPGPMDIQMERAALIDAASNRAGPMTAMPDAPVAAYMPPPVSLDRAAAFEDAQAQGRYDPLSSAVDTTLGLLGGRTVEEQAAIDAAENAAAPAFDDRGAAIADRAAGLEGIAATAAKTAEEAKADKEAAEAAILQGGIGGIGSGGGGSGIAGAASGMTSYEQELMDALARREKAATQDKWLALAQVGLNMMSSKQPTLLGAVGEAGLSGVQAMQGSRDQYEKDRLALSGELEQSRMARAQAAAAAAKGAGGGGGGLTAYQAATLSRGMRSDANEELGMLYERAAALAPGGVPLPAAVPQYEATTRRIAALENELYGGASADTGAGLYSNTDLTQ